MFNSIRARLTLWYVLVFGVLLAGFSLFIYVVLSKNLYSRVDRSLPIAAETVAAEFQDEMAENGGDAASGAAKALSELRFPEMYVAIYRGDSLLASDYPRGQRPVSPSSSCPRREIIFDRSSKPLTASEKKAHGWSYCRSKRRTVITTSPSLSRSTISSSSSNGSGELFISACRRRSLWPGLGIVARAEESRAGGGHVASGRAHQRQESPRAVDGQEC